MPLRSKRSGLALQVLQNAHKNLESKLSGLHAQEFKETSLEDARKAVLETEARMAARGCLRNTRRLMPLFEGLHHYSKAIEVLCNGVPFMPFVWAPVKFVINVTCENVKAFDKIIIQYSRIGEALIRFKTLQVTFAEYPEFQQVVAVFYSDILEFNGEAYKFVTRSAWELFFLTSWGRFERRFESIMQNLEAHEKLLDNTADALNIAEARRHRELLQQDRVANMAKIIEEEQLQHASRYQEISAWLKVDDTEQALIFDSITQEVSKYPGTCDWITQHDRLRAWLRGDSKGSFLWLQGSPGSGKTSLANRLVAFLMMAPDSIVIRHFCDALTPVSTNYDSILRSLLFQLVRTNEDLVAYIHSLKTTEFLEKTVTPKALEDIIRNISGAVRSNPTRTQTIHIVIDGLDVCDDEKQKRLIWLLERLIAPATSAPCSYKVLIVSRRTELLRRRLRNVPIISLKDESTHVTKSIESYARQRFGSMRANLHELGIGDTQVKKLSEQLAAKADGMFLWARLVLDYVSRNVFYRGHEIEEAISVLPRELGEFYEKILQQTLSNFDKQSVQRLTSMFGWIAFAKRPLKKVELQSAITFALGNAEEENVVPSHILGLCSQLVEERPDSTLALIHGSVKEYLQSPESLVKVSEQTALLEHATASITCLLSAAACFGSRDPDDRRQQQLVLRGLHAFQLYAQEHWVDYLLLLGCTEKANAFTDTLHELMHRLSFRLEEIQQQEGPLASAGTSTTTDTRLECLQHLPGVHKAAVAILHARTLSVRASKEETYVISPSTPLGKVLSRYQAIIRDLLSKRNVTGTSLDKLADFQETHKLFAFTCRIGGCRRLAAGFETKNLRDQHEESHRSVLRCDVTGCQYPTFTSARALQRHGREVHAEKRPRRAIRRTSTETTLVNYRNTSQKAKSVLKRRRPESSRTASYLESDGGDVEQPGKPLLSQHESEILNTVLQTIQNSAAEPQAASNADHVGLKSPILPRVEPLHTDEDFDFEVFLRESFPTKADVDFDFDAFLADQSPTIAPLDGSESQKNTSANLERGWLWEHPEATTSAAFIPGLEPLGPDHDAAPMFQSADEATYSAFAPVPLGRQFSPPSPVHQLFESENPCIFCASQNYTCFTLPGGGCNQCEENGRFCSLKDLQAPLLWEKPDADSQVGTGVKDHNAEDTNSLSTAPTAEEMRPGPFDPHDDDAANGLFMLAQGRKEPPWMDIGLSLQNQEKLKQDELKMLDNFFRQQRVLEHQKEVELSFRQQNDLGRRQRESHMANNNMHTGREVAEMGMTPMEYLAKYGENDEESNGSNRNELEFESMRRHPDVNDVDQVRVASASMVFSNPYGLQPPASGH